MADSTCSNGSNGSVFTGPISSPDPGPAAPSAARTAERPGRGSAATARTV
ncbi:hypothetical protein ACFCX4_30470 [Kitasatospora sp. NPDC056327]